VNLCLAAWPDYADADADRCLLLGAVGTGCGTAILNCYALDNLNTRRRKKTTANKVK